MNAVLWGRSYKKKKVNILCIQLQLTDGLRYVKVLQNMRDYLKYLHSFQKLRGSVKFLFGLENVNWPHTHTYFLALFYASFTPHVHVNIFWVGIFKSKIIKAISVQDTHFFFFIQRNENGSNISPQTNEPIPPSKIWVVSKCYQDRQTVACQLEWAACTCARLERWWC